MGKNPYGVFFPITPSLRCRFAPFDVGWGLRNVQRVDVGPSSLHENRPDRNNAIADHTVERLEHAGSLSPDSASDLANRETIGLTGQRFADRRVEWRVPVNDPLNASESASAVLFAGHRGAVHLLSDVARRARRDQIGEIVRAALTNGHDVVNVQHDVRRELAAVAAGELVAFEDGPAGGVPPISGLPWCSHAVIVSHRSQRHQIADGVIR